MATITTHPFYAECYRKRRQGGHAICCRMLPVVLPELHHEEMEINIHLHNALASKNWHSATGRNQSRTLREGEISLTSREQPHSVDWRQEAETVLLFLAPDAFALNPHETLRGSSETVEAYRAEDPLMLQLSRRLYDDLSQDSPFGASYPDALLITMTVHVLQQYAARSQPAMKQAGRLPAQALRRVQEYVAAHLHDDLTLSEMAAAAEYSPFHFCRMFRQSTGLSPHHYVVQRQVEEGKRLLLTTSLTIGEVAHSVGFASHVHFTRHFRRLIGVIGLLFFRD